MTICLCLTICLSVYLSAGSDIFSRYGSCTELSVVVTRLGDAAAVEQRLQKLGPRRKHVIVLPAAVDGSGAAGGAGDGVKEGNQGGARLGGGGGGGGECCLSAAASTLVWTAIARAEWGAVERLCGTAVANRLRTAGGRAGGGAEMADHAQSWAAGPTSVDGGAAMPTVVDERRGEDVKRALLAADVAARVCMAALARQQQPDPC